MWMFWILMSVAVIMIMWAAYLYATAQDDAEQASQARRTIFYAAIAIIVALLAEGFPLVIANIFSVSGVQGC